MVERTNNLSKQFIRKLESDRYKAGHKAKVWRTLCGVLFATCIVSAIGFKAGYDANTELKNILQSKECKQ